MRHFPDTYLQALDKTYFKMQGTLFSPYLGVKLHIDSWLSESVVICEHGIVTLSVYKCVVEGVVVEMGV